MSDCSTNAFKPKARPRFYRFPPMKNLDEVTAAEQLDKLREEVEEAVEANCALYTLESTEGYFSDQACEAALRYGMELMDVVHAAETALRIDFAECEIEGIRAEVEKKNRERGYYDEQAVD